MVTRNRTRQSVQTICYCLLHFIVLFKGELIYHWYNPVYPFASSQSIAYIITSSCLLCIFIILIVFFCQTYLHLYLDCVLIFSIIFFLSINVLVAFSNTSWSRVTCSSRRKMTSCWLLKCTKIISVIIPLQVHVVMATGCCHNTLDLPPISLWASILRISGGCDLLIFIASIVHETMEL